MKKDLADSLNVAARIALLVVSLLCGFVVIVTGARAALAATLRSEAVITGEYIRLGDIFEGTKNADYVLGPAPQPGKDMILNARTLYKIASALDVDWSPSSSTEQLILRREASVIPLSEITASLEEKIKAAGVQDKFTLDYASGMNDIVLPGDAEQTLAVTAFKFDAQSDRFNAVIVAPSAEKPLKRMSVSGRIERLIAVPVLKNNLRNGDIIGAMDIDWIDMPQGKIASGTALDSKQLINMTPRRSGSAGKPLLLSELASPTMVDRGDAVTLVFESGPMVLTAKGKAMQAGALGDMIHVSNTDSNKNLQGVVTAHREITIR
ncbi:MAG: flagella basal body P-ring formation protein FlgA [Micavibrio aeruginosavorus]|uniref:Flagella basal body P-ring formation protein FlgA n=1 Tax=Micavibrio aeruginosavorus TaxID=349221 RepID=A0A2W5N4W6_9BACT|nr:MAG: flagella basal body P-ring formation protein FlgA [Micavibrio aeruginosavorus]